MNTPKFPALKKSYMTIDKGVDEMDKKTMLEMREKVEEAHTLVEEINRLFFPAEDDSEAILESHIDDARNALEAAYYDLEDLLDS